VGGRGSARIAEIIGVGRLTEMMLTGRGIDADMGDRIGLSHYIVEPGGARDKTLEIAERVAGNAQISGNMMLHGLGRISRMSPEDGFFTGSLAQALTMTSPDARAGIDAFLKKSDIPL